MHVRVFVYIYVSSCFLELYSAAAAALFSAAAAFYSFIYFFLVFSVFSEMRCNIFE